MQFDHLDDFLDVANTLNFTKSSKNLNMAQSTLSRHIADLEKSLGVRLLERTTNSVKLTDEGKLFYERASTLLTSYSETLSELARSFRTPTRTVRVGGGTIQPVICNLFSQLAGRCGIEERFKLAYSRTRSFSEETPSYVAADLLRERELDFVIESVAPDSSLFDEFASLKICFDDLVVLASRENEHTSEKNLALGDLRDCTPVVMAVYQHCPKLMSYPLVTSGFERGAIKTAFVGDILEIPARLARLQRNEIVLLQEHFYRTFGFGRGLESRLSRLDVKDPLARVSYWAFWNKSDESYETSAVVKALEDLVAERRESARPNEKAPDGTVHLSAFIG